MNIDNLLKTIFWDIENNKLSNTYKRYIQIKHRYPNITQYINNKYNDSTSIQESITRIVYNIEIRPTCPICGGPVDFIGKANSKGIFKKHCSHTCSSKNKETILKANATSLLRHGSKNCPEKSKQTKKERYGDENYNNRKQTIITNQKKYGGVAPLCSIDILNKTYKTKKINRTFNTSQLEEDSYIIIKDKYDDVIRQYKDERYPFNCDFYIPSLDLFIEIQGLWTHGKHPYNENNNDDVELANKWKTSSSKYYNSAYETWAIKDVLKRNIAKHNNLNYIELWNIDDVIKFIES